MKVGDKYEGYICVGTAQSPPQWATVEDVEKVVIEYLETLPGHWEYIFDKDDY